MICKKACIWLSTAWSHLDRGIAKSDSVWQNLSIRVYLVDIVQCCGSINVNYVRIAVTGIIYHYPSHFLNEQLWTVMFDFSKIRIVLYITLVQSHIFVANWGWPLLRMMSAQRACTICWWWSCKLLDCYLGLPENTHCLCPHFLIPPIHGVFWGGFYMDLSLVRKHAFLIPILWSHSHMMFTPRVRILITALVAIKMAIWGQEQTGRIWFVATFNVTPLAWPCRSVPHCFRQVIWDCSTLFCFVDLAG